MADIFELVGKISLDGIDRAEKDLNSLSDTGEKSASKLGKLGGIAKTVGKGILIGAGAVVTGTAGLVKQVSASYGQLQQSIGGIETLFGESAQKVIDNANNAYTTAGISANEYMQLVTSFSASLLQSVGGDTEKAAEYANRAVIDMADNANKMGTSMEDIQHAYQGFSKQNYTMLDNLKLGYGGTKSEMERLIKDASKLTEVQEKLGITVDKVGFDKKFSEHQEKSRLGSAQKFKGGLASTGDAEIKYHTATHLLNAALKEVLGSHVHQRGSNITAERMRFDFSHDSKMTSEELKKTEDLVNSYIKASIPVIKTEEKKEDAIANGAEAMFVEKYGDIVTVYTIGDVSKELCGGPHVNNTSELGHFKIIKEEASSAGVRRIKAILE